MAKKNNYLNNKKLYECIQDYTSRCRKAEAEGKEKPPMPEYAGACIHLICTRMGTRWNFVGYTFREEMVGDAILDCVHAFYNFDSDRFNNPFGYFSRVGWRAMIRKIFTEKRETYLKHKNYQMATISGSEYEVPSDYTDPMAIRVGANEATADGKDMSDGVISSFEALLTKRREKRDAKTAEAKQMGHNGGPPLNDEEPKSEAEDENTLI